jgi:hypothetical protein
VGQREGARREGERRDTTIPPASHAALLFDGLSCWRLVLKQAERLSRELRDFDQMLADREHRKRVDQWRNDKMGR